MSGPELARLLGEIGLLAAGYGLNGHAQAILAAVRDLSPVSAAPAVGASIALMTAGRSDEAADLLERALDEVAERDRQAVAALLGWALQRSGRRARSEQVLQALVAGSNDPGEPALGLAAALLDQTSDRR
jgi:tetratricopeptide (TPR) repeat protein